MEEATLDILEWLQTASTAELLEYARKVLDKTPTFFKDIREDLLGTLRGQRTREMKKYFDGNYLEFFTEEQILSFITKLIQYNASSVVEKALEKNVGLSLTVKGDPLAWARIFLKQWQGVFYLLSAEEALARGVYLTSVIRQNYLPEIVTEKAKLLDQYLNEVEELLRNNNYSAAVLGPAEREELIKFMGDFQFLPREVISDLLQNPKRIADLHRTLTSIQFAFNAIQTASVAGTNAADPEAVFNLMWDNLRMLEETKELARYIELQKREKVDTSNYIYKLAEGLYETLVPINFETGAAFEQISTYHASLKPAQQQEFREVIEAVYTDSPYITPLFEPIEMDYFMNTLRKKPDKGTRIEFVNSLENSIPPDVWPITQKAMLLLAEIF
jgi:hypothetical protein